MFEKLKNSFSCFGTPQHKKQQIFLIHRRQSSELQSPQPVIRFIKDTQVINETEGNGMKKSLKKRQGTYAHPSSRYYTIDEANKVEAYIQSSQHKLPIKNKNFLKKGVQTPIQTYSNAMPFKCPATTTLNRQTPLANSRRQFLSDTPEDYPYVIHEPYFLNYIPKQRNNIQLRHQVLNVQNQNNSLNYTSQVVINQNRNDGVHEIEPKPSAAMQQICNHQIISNNGSFIRSQSELWSQPNQDHSLIEDFQKLFKNVEDSNFSKISFSGDSSKKQHYSNFSKISIKENKSSFSREAEKQKADQQQQKLIGRLAESEDEALSEAPRSQIIGKGFDLMYQDLLDPNELFTIEQTKASSSTNTKISDFRGQKHKFNKHQKIRFGKSPHFTNYGHL